MTVYSLFFATIYLQLLETAAMEKAEAEIYSAECQAVVPYQPSLILPMFAEHIRNFDIAGKSWAIQQRWDEMGVASVVWEPVGLVWSVCVCAYTYPLPDTLSRPCCWLSI
jgi:hypothetical protein